jgi:tRNA pseudouridine38-40 synthase
VHALANVVSVTVAGGPPLGRVAVALNPRLPDAVSVVAAEEVAPEFNARFDARSRSYRYRLHTRSAPSPFEAHRSWWYPQPIDEERLQAQAAVLAGAHDFRAFTPTQTQHRVFTRRVRSAAWTRRGDFLEFEITADSFLRRMVRSLVGTMLDGVDLAPLLDGAPRRRAGATAPPHGLYLVDVAYDDPS